MTHITPEQSARMRGTSRRQFLALASGVVSSAILAACGGEVAPTVTTAPQVAATRPPTQAPVVAGASPVATSAPPSTVAATPAAATNAAPVVPSMMPTAPVAPTAGTTPSIVAMAGKPGGTKVFRVALLGDLTQLDPALINSQVDFQIAEALYNYIGRYTYNPPLGNAITPELAEWEVLDGAKTYIFHLKKGVKFHGSMYGELTAADVKANWERLKDPKTASPYRSDFSGSTIEVLDANTLKVSFDRSYPSFISASLAFRPGLVISPKAYADAGDQWKTRPIGTGPFMFDSYQAGSSLSLKRNPNYWGTPAKVDQVTYKFKVDDRAAVLAVARGELDAYYLSDPDIAASVAKNPDPNTRFLKSQFGQAPMTIWFNMKKKPLDDLRVRQALRYAIDNVSIAKNLFSGLADPIHSFLPPFMFGFSDEVTRFDYNPDKARQLLKEANVSPDWSPSLLTLSNLIIDRRIIEAVASYWTDVGIKVKAEALEQGIINQRTSAGDFDMYGTYVARIDPDQLATPYWRSEATANRSFYTGADSLIDRAKAEPDPVQRAKIYRDLQDKVSQDSPAAFIVAVSESLLINKRVTGIAGAGWQERYDWFNLDVPAE